MVGKTEGKRLFRRCRHIVMLQLKGAIASLCCCCTTHLRGSGPGFILVMKVNHTVLGVTFEVTVLFGSMYLQFNAYTAMKF